MNNIEQFNRGQLRRRNAILGAARRLVHDGSLTMRRLASEAGVSPATPYNLFGTKRNVLSALARELSLEMAENVKNAPAVDGLDRMFMTFDIVFGTMAGAPDFYRRLLAEFYGDSATPEDLLTAQAVWDVPFDGLYEDGIIDPSIDREQFRLNFTYIFGGAVWDWTLGRTTLADAEQATHYGFALSTLAVATDSSRERVRDLVNGSCRVRQRLAAQPAVC